MFGVRAKKTQFKCIKVNIYKYNKSKYCDEGLYSLEYQVLYTPVNYKLLKNKKMRVNFVVIHLAFLCASK